MNTSDTVVCQGILDFLKQKHGNLYSFFVGPAQAVLAPSLAARYQQLIEKPRDLEMISLKLQNGMYQSLSDFGDDCTLCFANAKLFCSQYKEFKGVHDAAVTINKHFTKKFDTEMKNMQKQSAKGKGGGRPSLPHGGATRKANAGRQSILEHKNILIERVVKPLKVEQGAAILGHPVYPSMDFYELYKARIKEPMDFETILSKLAPIPQKPVMTKKDRLSSGSPLQNFDKIEKCK